MPNDDGLLSNYSDEEKNRIIKKYPFAEKFFRKFLGADEFINNKNRWCLWLKDANLIEIKKVQPIMEAIQKVKFKIGE